MKKKRTRESVFLIGSRNRKAGRDEYVVVTWHWIYCIDPIVPCLDALQKRSPIALAWKGNGCEKKEKEKKRNGRYSRYRLETEITRVVIKKKDMADSFVRNAQRPVCAKKPCHQKSYNTRLKS